MAKRGEAGAGEGAEVDLDVQALLEEMGRAGLRPAMIVFLGDTGVPRVATRGVDPVELLRDLARRSRAGRPCRRGAAAWHQASSDV
ncbi:MAG: hypothetical protein P8R42_21425 [Candidatus Binatia bacterium]|nr:hypothetical protein [Candidatus Binatia bacterium]